MNQRAVASLFALALFTLSACRTAPVATAPPTPAAAPPPAAKTTEQRVDPHSYARPEEAYVRHLALDLSVDFEQKRLAGSAALDIQAAPEASSIVLDARDLELESVMVDGKPVRYALGAPAQYVGQALTIPINPSSKQVVIRYHTRPDAAALQWLEPSQTAGGKLPFLFTQSEPILARTWIPLQDTPSVRITYDATIRVPRGLTAVMSAEHPAEAPADGVFHFHMPQPVAPYLVALAVGDLAFRPFDARSGVYAEPSVVDKAAWEFADTPKMIDAAEKLYGPYRWGRYDILVLPPSFPFGGMENPRLTFATPTLLAGDRSLVNVIAHELAHSWSGNLVTNATWNDFWLNEGFTNYFESRITESLYGRDYADMLAALEMQSLKETVAEFGATSADTKLHLDMAGRDPDDATNDIAYDKGFFFLRMLEEAVGRPRFDAFLRQYFSTFAFQSMTSARFIDYLDRNLLASRPDLQSRVQEWVYGVGLPASLPEVRSARLEKAEAEAARFAAGASASSLAAKGWSTQEWTRFLDALPPTLSREKIADLDSVFHLTESGNAAILQSWFVRTIRAGYAEANPALESYLMTVGRRYYIRPLYTELAKTPEGLAYARRIYAQARPRYHSVSRGTIDKILDWKG